MLIRCFVVEMLPRIRVSIGQHDIFEGIVTLNTAPCLSLKGLHHKHNKNIVHSACGDASKIDNSAVVSMTYCQHDTLRRCFQEYEKALVSITYCQHDNKKTLE